MLGSSIDIVTPGTDFVMRGRTLPTRSKKRSINEGKSPTKGKKQKTTRATTKTAKASAGKTKSKNNNEEDPNYSTASASSDESVVGMGALLDAVAMVEEKPKKKGGKKKAATAPKKKPAEVAKPPAGGADDEKAKPAKPDEPVAAPTKPHAKTAATKPTTSNTAAETPKEAAAPAAAVSDEEQQRMLGIHALIHVASSIETPGGKKRGGGKASSKNNKEERPKKRAATNNKNTKNSKEDKNKDTSEADASTSAAAGVDTLEIRPRGSLPGDDIFYPTDQELKEATTRRSRNALFSWYDRLRDLYAYKEEHGDCMVPQKYQQNHALGIWVNKQRMEKRLRDQGQKSTMTDHRFALLDKIGFHWAKHKGQVSWDQKYQELVEFAKIHGHVNVPTKFRENSALGRWISTQRAQMKEWRRGEKTSMTKERYAKLSALDFQFERLKTSKIGEGVPRAESKNKKKPATKKTDPNVSSLTGLPTGTVASLSGLPTASAASQGAAAAPPPPPAANLGADAATPVQQQQQQQASSTAPPTPGPPPPYLLPNGPIPPHQHQFSSHPHAHYPPPPHGMPVPPPNPQYGQPYHPLPQGYYHHPPLPPHGPSPSQKQQQEQEQQLQFSAPPAPSPISEAELSPVAEPPQEAV